MKKNLIVVFALLISASFLSVSQSNAYIYTDNFSTPWTGYYAPGWDNEGYRWGDAPTAIMNPYTIDGISGVKVSVISQPLGWEWWGVVYNTQINTLAMAKQYDPYMQVSYYDEGGSTQTGQLYAVPQWVVQDDWTDVQFGARARSDISSNYYFFAADLNGSGWTDTGIQRSIGWHQLKFQISSADGKIHFFLDGTEVGTSVRSDLMNLDTIILGTMYSGLLSSWGENYPYSIFANVQVGSTYVPEPATMLLLVLGLVGIARFRRRMK